MIIPSPLKAGDKIAIVATARKISHREIEPAVAVLKSWGLDVVIGKTIAAEHFQFAGEDELRKNDLQEMLDDETISAILFARGGYGTVRIIDDIDWRKYLKKPKWLCGFSDITVIHSHLLSVFEIASIHSVMALSFETASVESLESLRRMLFGDMVKYDIKSHPLNRSGEARGILCGGNLSLLYNLNGTVSDIETAGKILFVEDIDEHLYHVDRMMINLKRSGKLEDLAGLIVGHFTDMKNKDDQNPFGKDGYQIIAEHVADYNYPVCFGFPAGHEPQNHALKMGGNCELRVEEESHIRFLEPN